MVEYLSYYIVKVFGFFVRLIPVHLALWLGRMIGIFVYYFDTKHKSLAYANLKIAFAKTKTPREIVKITKMLFQNYGQNLIELLRLPLMTPARFDKYIRIEGKEHLNEALKKGKGVIMLAMHYGSWEMASLASGMMGVPYSVVVKPQKKFEKLDELLNSFRQSNGSVVIERGFGTRRLLEALKENQIVGMVVDQGGKAGTLVPFFGRHASMSDGAIRIGLKLGVPICFAIITREKGPYHHFIIHEPLDLEKTGSYADDLKNNLRSITQIMENYIINSPAEYMWFYKIWKYSKESTVVILDDGRTGHLRQSEAVAGQLMKALAERGVAADVKTITLAFKNKLLSKLLSGLMLFSPFWLSKGKFGFLRFFLLPSTYQEIISVKADYVISCGSSTASLNYLLSYDNKAKNIVILKPGLIPLDKFNCVILPQHDYKRWYQGKDRIVMTGGAPNLVTDEYLDEQKDLLLKRFSHLKLRNQFKIGLLIGGHTKDYSLGDQKIRILINQIKEVAQTLDADILVTTSRRTSAEIENMLIRELKREDNCPLLIIANRQNVPEAVGGILGISDIVVVSGDSISMMSEAASSGKKVVVFPVQGQSFSFTGRQKHNYFIGLLHNQGYVLSADVRNIKEAILNLAKNKIQTKRLNDHEVIFHAMKRII